MDIYSTDNHYYCKSYKQYNEVKILHNLISNS